MTACGKRQLTICLNMIVKDESRVIRRCLDTVRPWIDHWVIVDTGSTDGTQGIIREHLKDIPGELHERPWKDFGHNRTEALELAKGKAVYTLVIDADEVLIVEPGFEMPLLDADAYQTLHLVGDSGTSFYLTNIVHEALDWRYVGVLHEAITCDSPHAIEKLEGIVVKGLFDGARNTDPKKKYEQDAAVLEAALAGEPDNARYVFYLAQCYRDAGQLEASLEAYNGALQWVAGRKRSGTRCIRSPCSGNGWEEISHRLSRPTCGPTSTGPSAPNRCVNWPGTIARMTITRSPICSRMRRWRSRVRRTSSFSTTRCTTGARSTNTRSPPTGSAISRRA